MKTRAKILHLIYAAVLMVFCQNCGTQEFNGTSQSSSSASLTLEWDANTESELAGYKLYYGKSAGNYTHSVDVGNVTTFAVNGLSAATTYYFVVRAYDSSMSEAADSNEVFRATP